jgi:hypothetical protein
MFQMTTLSDSKNVLSSKGEVSVRAHLASLLELMQEFICEQPEIESPSIDSMCMLARGLYFVYVHSSMNAHFLRALH